MDMSAITLCVFAYLVIAEAKPAEKFGMPAPCAGLDFCTKQHELYPVGLVNEMLQRANITFSSESTVHRSDEGSVEERDCAVLTDYDPIYEIVDSDGVVRVVLQSNSGFQTVPIERCLKPGHIDYPTTHFDLDMVNKFNLQCMEEKLKVNLLVLTKDWTGFEMVAPKTGIPVRCDCKFFKN